MPIAQESEYGTSSELDLESIKYSFDYLTKICQIISRQLSRTVKIQEGSEQSIDEFIAELKEGNNLAKKWAEFTDGTVDGSGYSSKYHALEAANYVNEAQAQAELAQQYAQNARFGLKWIGFTSANWTAGGGEENNYTLTLSDVPIVCGVFKGSWADKHKVINIDAEITSSGAVLTSPEAFDGFILTSASVLGSYTHTQTLASDEWIINHNLGCYPVIIVTDNDYAVLECTKIYNSLNKITLQFAEPVTGKVFLR